MGSIQTLVACEYMLNITASQLVAHVIGDYILQTDTMANEKTKRSLMAALQNPVLDLVSSFVESDGIHRGHTLRDRPVATRSVPSLGEGMDHLLLETSQTLR